PAQMARALRHTCAFSLSRRLVAVTSQTYRAYPLVHNSLVLSEVLDVSSRKKPAVRKGGSQAAQPAGFAIRWPRAPLAGMDCISAVWTYRMIYDQFGRT